MANVAPTPGAAKLIRQACVVLKHAVVPQSTPSRQKLSHGPAHGKRGFPNSVEPDLSTNLTEAQTHRGGRDDVLACDDAKGLPRREHVEESAEETVPRAWRAEGVEAQLHKRLPRSKAPRQGWLDSIAKSHTEVKKSERGERAPKRMPGDVHRKSTAFCSRLRDALEQKFDEFLAHREVAGEKAAMHLHLAEAVVRQQLRRMDERRAVVHPCWGWQPSQATQATEQRTQQPRQASAEATAWATFIFRRKSTPNICTLRRLIVA
mmetsp:Transcript_117395/g.332199  ORF Transcript_117395/g.332199 Transcript_117395/m.332199 type:complete len:263 (-) Transcript_117395:957-1745(-)